jgi:hypothetical protein
MPLWCILLFSCASTSCILCSRFEMRRTRVCLLGVWSLKSSFRPWQIFQTQSVAHGSWPDPLGIRTVMKSNAQLRHEAQGVVRQHPPDLPTAAASLSQTVPPSFDISSCIIITGCPSLLWHFTFAHLMSSMSALQREVNLIGERLEQSQIDIRECLKYHHPKPHDDDDWVFLCSILFWLSNNFKFVLTFWCKY